MRNRGVRKQRIVLVQTKMIRFLFIVISIMFLHESVAEAYIGPGAGFAFVSSFFIFFITIFLAILTIFFWPLRLIVKVFVTRKKSNSAKHGIKRVVIVGLDGMDPDLAARYMKEGKLPNLLKLSSSGTYQKLQTTLPSISPVAWSTFITGVDPSRHNIFDFLNRDLNTYLPELSSTKIEKNSKTFSLGSFSLLRGKPRVKLLRKSKPFWNILGEYGIFSSVIRIPITFPPEKLKGVLLSGMCVPDLKGTQGTFTIYTSNNRKASKRIGGIQVSVSLEGNKIKTYIPGPNNNLSKDNEELRIPLEITLSGNEIVVLKIAKEKFMLKKRTYSKWIKLSFRCGPAMKICGICRFFVKQIHPKFEMYMTPIHIDPEKPSLPISFPLSYSIYLAKMNGSYATLGLAEDTWALNERVIDEDVFLDQAYQNHQEREKMFFDALDKTREGLCVCVFDTTDRIQHMFMRFMSENHPALDNGVDREKYRDVIEKLYMRMDSLIGQVMEKIKEKDVLIVLSDHGFKLFSRGVNLNTWLYKNGYLTLRNRRKTGREWFQDIDWKKTKAYTFGLSGIYINQTGRESKGIVLPEDKEGLKKELIKKLQGLIDEGKKETAIKKVYNSTECFDGPYRENGPDLIIGYNEGYRASWGAALGKVEEEVFADNKKSWSGDHCMDPQIVPGVFYCNKKIISDKPHIIDMAPTILDLFGIEPPSYMNGKSLIN